MATSFFPFFFFWPRANLEPKACMSVAISRFGTEEADRVRQGVLLCCFLSSGAEEHSTPSARRARARRPPFTRCIRGRGAGPNQTRGPRGLLLMHPPGMRGGPPQGHGEPLPPRHRRTDITHAQRGSRETPGVRCTSWAGGTRSRSRPEAVRPQTCGTRNLSNQGQVSTCRKRSESQQCHFQLHS